MVWQTQSDLVQARAIAVPGPGSLGQQAWAKWGSEAPRDNEEFLDGFLSVSAAAQIFDTFKDGNSLPDRVPELQTILTYASFPATYLHADIAAMLASTGILTDHRTVPLRMVKTGERMTAIYTSAEPNHGGLINAMRLGRVHSLFSQPGSCGNTMNQVSMAFTLLTFSQVVLQSPQLGDVPVRVAEGWLKMWNVIGGLMGIVDDGLPPTLDAAAALYQLILASPPCAALSDDGSKLVAAYAQAFDPGVAAKVSKYGGEDLARRLGLIP